MIIFTLNKTRYKLKNEWQELTLEEAMTIRDLEQPKAADMFDLFKHIDKLKVIMAHFTDAPIDNIPPAWVVSLYSQHVERLITALQTSEILNTYAPRMITDFKHKGKTYLLPTNLDLGYDVILQHGQKAKSFVEASNLLKVFSEMKTEGIKTMPMFVASVVKQDKDEVWDEQQIVNRANEFRTLTMDIVWEVFFCTMQHLRRLQLDTLQSLSQRKRKRKTVIQGLASRVGRLRLREVELRERLRILTR